MGVSRSPIRSAPAEPDGEGDDSALDFSEVPATVVCASCGLPECGCEAERPSAFSGIVAIVPWERRGTLLGRLWATAKLATLAPEAFFGSLPPGALAAPLGFALLAELLSALGLGATLGLGLLALWPALAHEIFARQELRELALRGTLLGVPALAGLMVALHAGHGLALDTAARRAGSRQAGRGLRFGLYSCGWDLMTLPLGLLMLVVTDGPAAALRCAPRGLTAPRRAALAYLVQVHQFEREQARGISGSALWLVVVPMLVIVTVVTASGLLWAAH